MKKLFLVLLLFGLVGCSSLKGLIKQRGEKLLSYNEPQIELKTNQGSFYIDLTSSDIKFKDEIISFDSFRIRFVNPSTGEVLFTDGHEWYKELTNGVIIEITEVDVDNFLIFGITIK